MVTKGLAMAKHSCLYSPDIFSVQRKVFSDLRLFDLSTANHSYRTFLWIHDKLEAMLTLPDGSIFCLAEIIELSGISRHQVYRAALFHDIGKIYLPRDLLFSGHRLKSIEKKIVEKHEIFSGIILNQLGWDVEAKIAKQHHNYGCEQIEVDFYFPPLCCKIGIADLLHLADMQEALLAERCYKPGLTPLKTLSMMVKEAQSGKVGKEATFIWLWNEMKDKNLINRQYQKSTNWKDLLHLITVNNFLREEWGFLKSRPREEQNQTGLKKYQPIELQFA